MAWDPETFGLDGSYTASPTLAEDDPLRAWAQNLTPEDLQHLQGGNAKQAIDNLISRGVPPPPPQVMAYTDPMGNETGGAEPPFRLDSAATDAWRKNTPQAPQDVPLPQADPRKTAPMPSFDPEPDGPDDTASGGEIPLPKPRPPEAGPGASDISAQSKSKKVTEGLGGFAQSLAGVKAPTAPPLNAVGTPAAPHPAAIQAPNVTQLLQLIGQQSQPNALQTLGRLLVAGKA